MKLNKYIDHTLLKAEATEKDIIKLCDEAKNYDFASVCINPIYVSLAKKTLQGSNVKVCTVVGFPLGANTQAIKVAEIKDALANGADEIDMVMNIGLFLSEQYEKVEAELIACKKAADTKILKVIFETCLLSKDQIIKACQLAAKANVDFVKTSTGFNKSGATIEVVSLMKKSVPSTIQVKAAGGIRNKIDALAMIEAGATRIGTSGGIAIVEDKGIIKGY